LFLSSEGSLAFLLLLLPPSPSFLLLLPPSSFWIICSFVARDMTRRATALYECVGEDDQEISFKDGQVLFDGCITLHSFIIHDNTLNEQWTP
jgi:hypothetical protein